MMGDPSATCFVCLVVSVTLVVTAANAQNTTTSTDTSMCLGMCGSLDSLKHPTHGLDCFCQWDCLKWDDCCPNFVLTCGADSTFTTLTSSLSSVTVTTITSMDTSSTFTTKSVTIISETTVSTTTVLTNTETSTTFTSPTSTVSSRSTITETRTGSSVTASSATTTTSTLTSISSMIFFTLPVQNFTIPTITTTSVSATTDLDKPVVTVTTTNSEGSSSSKSNNQGVVVAVVFVCIIVIAALIGFFVYYKRSRAKETDTNKASFNMHQVFTPGSNTTANSAYNSVAPTAEKNARSTPSPTYETEQLEDGVFFQASVQAPAKKTTKRKNKKRIDSDTGSVGEFISPLESRLSSASIAESTLSDGMMNDGTITEETAMDALRESVVFFELKDDNVGKTNETETDSKMDNRSSYSEAMVGGKSYNTNVAYNENGSPWDSEEKSELAGGYLGIGPGSDDTDETDSENELAGGYLGIAPESGKSSIFQLQFLSLLSPESESDDDDDGDDDDLQTVKRTRDSHMIAISAQLGNHGAATPESEGSIGDSLASLSPVSPTPSASLAPSPQRQSEYFEGFGELGFVQGQTTNVSDDEEDFDDDELAGFDVHGDPRLHDWYVGDMDEEKCERSVLAANAGDFLVRSTDISHFLYINDFQRLKKIPITKTGNGDECKINNDVFPDLGHALEHLQRRPVLSVRGTYLNLSAAAPTTA
eukprot:m.50605 g.50605  ORF g.50605 m.50605 type:complete len:705 (+) comp10681_c0_seq1:185-2299(+)